MPKTPINYDSTYFYKFCCKDLNITDIYVGHTTNFRVRKNNHIHSYLNQHSKKYHYRLYSFIRDHGGWNNWDMILIDVHRCDDALDARKKEREYIEIESDTKHGYAF